VLSIKSRWLGFVVLALAAAHVSGSAGACGPHFPNSVIVEGDGFVTSAPAASFRALVERIDVPKPEFAANSDSRCVLSDRTVDAGQRELLVRLTELEVPAGLREDILFSHIDFRKALEPVEDGERREGPLPKLHPQMPKEFSNYLLGAALYHVENLTVARAMWTYVLALPESERRYRSVWAAYMIGRSFVDGDPKQAAKWFGKTRALARAGFHDRLGLASASYGWAARAALNQGRIAQALELYLTQYACGDDETALESLRIAAAQALDGTDEQLRDVVRSDIARQIVNAEVLAWHSAYLEWGHAGQESMTRWLEAVEAAAPLTVRDADRLAWAAYRIGADDMAARWLAKADPSSTVGRWIRAKLLLREGKIDEAAEHLAMVVQSFEAGGDDVTFVWPSLAESQGTTDKVLGELAALRLSQGEAAQALDVLLRTENHWVDAAYIAELVLSPDELMAYIERMSPDGKHAASVRSLCCRRLMRLERFDDALKTAMGEQRAWVQAFVDDLRFGRDGSHSAVERAAALWSAAQLLREHGMEMRGTEFAPDFAIWGGAYEWMDMRSIRLSNDGPLTKPTVEERLRLKQRTDVVPFRRFHYRYVAADMAWDAAALMPDESEETATVLCTAGSWIKIADPDWADRFYQALIRRCGRTKLGRQAVQLKWFPKLE